ncbi:MAG TPA: DUF5666 domain-containing protein [Thermoanaerobaculia bacterium]|nr:DUF5666 domain-containing protein [Thermoanaerobaculia bacterium]
MTGNLRSSAVFAILVLLAVSTFAQSSPQYGTTGTVVDVDTGNRRLQIETDAGGARLTVEVDPISTSFYGFGTVIAGKPEIFTGSSGFSNVRLGDRIRVEGTSRAAGVTTAASITLLGREVAASQVGVGQTRTPGSVSTSTETRPTLAPGTSGTIEGTIRQLSADEGRLVIQTTQRRMMTVRTYRNTPVVYRGQTYRVTNLEVGDVIRIEADPRDAQTDEITARRIEVVQSVQEAEPGRDGGTVTTIEGQIKRTEPGLDYAYVNDGRREIRVDMSDAEDAEGERIHARDLRTGDNVEITGGFNRVGDIFLASTLRFTSGTPREIVEEPITRYSLVTFTGTITETLEDAATIAIRDRDLNRIVRVWVTDDFIVRTKGTTTTTAENLRVNDTVLVKAFRDPSGNLIAQTIRLRNR